MRKRLPGMHYSFGDGENAQLPHIVFPLWDTADQLIVTRPGDSPPKLGMRLEEDSAHQKARFAKGSRHAWSLENTYSFSFCTTYLDLPNWKLVGVAPGRFDPVPAQSKTPQRISLLPLLLLTATVPAVHCLLAPNTYRPSFAYLHT